MRTWTATCIHLLTWGQAGLLVLLLRDPGFADSLWGVLLWFALLPGLLVLIIWLGLDFAIGPLPIPWFNNHFRASQRWILAGVALINLVIWTGGRFHRSNSGEPHPVVVFGPDGADWQIIDTLAAQGRLPNLSACLQAGCRAELTGAEPLFSPVLWTTMAAGRPAAQNGLAGHLSDLNASLITCRRIWDIVEQEGKTCGVVQYPGLWPLGPAPGAFAIPSFFEGGVNSRPEGYDFIGRFMQKTKQGKSGMGALVRFGLACWGKGMRLSTADYALASLLQGAVTPNSYRKPILRYRFWVFLERLHLDLFCHLYRREHPDLALYYFPTLDGVEHLYFSAYRPQGFRRLNPEDVRRLGGIIPDVYAEMDRALGRLRACAGAEARFLMISDHGMKTTCELARPGCSRVYNGSRSFPEWLGYSDKQIEWIQGFDRVYLAPKTLSGISYAEIMEKAGEARLAQNGMPLWTVGFRDGLGQYHPEAPSDGGAGYVEIAFQIPDSLPDSAQVSLPLSTMKLSELAAAPDNILVQGAHSQGGMFLAWGPGLRTNERLAKVNQLDVLPTLLSLLELPGARDLPGRSADIFTPEAAAHLPAAIDTYENPTWKTLPSPEQQARDRVQEAMREQMRTRGYIN